MKEKTGTRKRNLLEEEQEETEDLTITLDAALSSIFSTPTGYTPFLPNNFIFSSYFIFNCC